MSSQERTDLASASFLDSESFDIVVVGGGTAGLVVASRLTEDPSTRVLVIEAGADRRNDPRILTPGLAAATYFDPEFDWCITSKPQPGLNGRLVAEPKARTLGGSTAINLGMVAYPSKSGFDAWEKLGNPGWDWAHMTPYFRKFHTFHKPSDKIREQLSIDWVDEELSGTDGPIHTSFGEDHYLPYNDAWAKTFEKLGHKMTGDPLSGVSKGAYTNPGVIDPKTHQRSHAGNAYLSPEVEKRPNLRVLTETLVNKVILEPNTDGIVSAKGVQVTTKDGKIRDVSVKDEVILAAGALKTPQVLELSGIGDKKLLESHGIKTLIDSPGVGENMQEHGFVCFNWEVTDGMVSGDVMRDPAIIGQLMGAFAQGGAGPLGVCNIQNAYVHLPEFAGEQGRVELDKLLEEYIDKYQYKNFPAQKKQYELLSEILRHPDTTSGQHELAPFQVNPELGPSPKDLFGFSIPGQYITITSVLNHPFSRGSVHIVSSKAEDQPELDVGLFDHPLDVELQARHSQILEELAHTEPLASLLKKDGKRLHTDKPFPYDLETTKELVRDRITPHFHLSGSTPMMPKEIGGVVNERLMVYGTKNLRIVDAGIFPLIPRGNIQVDVYAVAEKAADIIKEDRGLGLGNLSLK
ncbi:putative aryl-alcohol dehydrogenase [Massarina eburnea CBS 473.64]|uniref:Putative aryl-alcohol dehydrogenase n=1 Tax=Massarina eburnea CBS 473.64 TaxID=1395130 RepID=A0A6A6RR49_9PLEO|nr:putative aryl-alcohol dehydrogenase [Massarina eburnea CBS 473.64]